MVRSFSMKAPEPTGCLPKSPFAASTASFGTAEAKSSASTLRKVASGWPRWKRIVWSSTTSMPERVWDEPSVTLSAPTMEWKKPAPGPCVLGLTARSIEYLRSPATTSRPLVNFTPGCILNV